MDRPGYELPLLLAGGFRLLIDELHEHLAEQGHPELRPVHGFALQAVGTDGATISEIGRRLGVSKQAAAKTVAGLENLGYVERQADPSDGRAYRVVLTRRGTDALAASARIFDQLRRRWVRRLGRDRVAALEDDLERIAGPAGVRLADLPGWLR
jgi:DNA-binding MarR family transcriptional regulator